MSDVALVVSHAFRTSTAAGPPLSLIDGDFNRDGHIGLADLIHLRNRFDTQVSATFDGDLTGDGFVDLADVAWLVSNIGASAVPPPAAIVAHAGETLRAVRLVPSAADRILNASDNSLTAQAARRGRGPATADKTPVLEFGEPSPRLRPMLRAARRDAAGKPAARDLALSDIIDGR
jgi:hypothetical protein